MSAWQVWHRSYDEPGSVLSQRLEAIVRLLRRVLDEAAPGPIAVLSLCAGEARDLRAALTDHPRTADVVGQVVETDPVLAAQAERNLRHLGSHLTVTCGDASQLATFRSTLPVDVLLLCGIFGNVAVPDIARTIASVPGLCNRDAAVLWTRHRGYPDITPWIRQQFSDNGSSAHGFVASPPEGPGWHRSESYSVGLQRYRGPHRPDSIDNSPLFTFATGPTGPKSRATS